MNQDFDFVGSGDRPALIAFSSPEWLAAAKLALEELGYKVHTAATHSDFLTRFSQVRYQAVLLEELFGANVPAENMTLKSLQTMPVGQRRHATVLLIGHDFQTFAPLEAFKNSVHAVINSSELFLLKQLVEKAVADNNAFLQSYRDVQSRILASGSRS